jgi:hypothetical protein
MTGEGLRQVMLVVFGIIGGLILLLWVPNYIQATETRLVEQRAIAVEQAVADLRIAHPTWSQHDCELVAAGKVTLGMTQEMVLAGWGRPNDINRSVGAWGVHEQWVYPANYLYFEDGVLTSWQD